jgi:hypothetical protein
MHFDPKRLSKSQTSTTGKRKEKSILFLPRTGDNRRDYLTPERWLFWVTDSWQVNEGVIPLARISE